MIIQSLRVRTLMPPIGGRYFAILAAICFAAGLNVYATIATLGLLARAGAIVLPASLHALESWWIIGASGGLICCGIFRRQSSGV